MPSEFELLCSRLGSATSLSRRQVLKSLAILGLMPGVAAGCTKEKNEPIDPATDIVFDATTIEDRPVRRNVANLGRRDDIIVAYEDAITQMQSLPESDPRNWQRQAEIHLALCPHSNWLFLPWHRHYLYWFERIVRTLSGMDDWALPYWNWIENPKIPGPFRQGILSHPRDRQEVRVRERQLDRALDVRNFLYFGSGRLEPGDQRREASTKSDFEQIHDSVHSRLGNIVDGMASFLSPLDPIFWLHHNYIDYIWVAWNVGRENPNPAESHWINFSFANDFVDGDGSAISGESALVEFCLLLPLVSYRFENSRVGSSMGSV
jgi:tyrosinase